MKSTTKALQHEKDYENGGYLDGRRHSVGTANVVCFFKTKCFVIIGRLFFEEIIAKQIFFFMSELSFLTLSLSWAWGTKHSEAVTHERKVPRILHNKFN